MFDALDDLFVSRLGLWLGPAVAESDGIDPRVDDFGFHGAELGAGFSAETEGLRLVGVAVESLDAVEVAIEGCPLL
jgi:hypothetical protein